MFHKNALQVGDTVSTTIGKLNIKHTGFDGGEGHGYLAKCPRGKQYFVKLFFDFDDLMDKPTGFTPDQFNRTIINRVNHLVKLNISQINSHFAAPIGTVTHSGMTGVVCEFFSNGITFEEWIQQPCAYNFRVEFVKELAVALHELHVHGIAHGDLNHKNILIDPNNPQKWQIIDFTNVYMPGQAEPLMLGQANTMPVSFNEGTGLAKEQIRPHTDVFAYAMLAHAALLNRWDFEGLDVEDSIKQRMVSALPGDFVAGGHSDKVLSGLSFSILPTRLQNWLRGAYNSEPSKRPTMRLLCEVLAEEFGKTYNPLFECPSCHMPFFYSRGRPLVCPNCDIQIPSVSLKISSGITKALTLNSTLGRLDLLHSKHADQISGKHLYFQPLPSGAILQVIGKNGANLYKADGQKIKLVEGSPEVYICSGDVVQVLDIQIEVL